MISPYDSAAGSGGLSLGCLIRSTERRLRRYTASRLNGCSSVVFANVDDVLQDSFLVMVECFDHFEGKGPRAFLLWAMRIVRNCIKNRTRHHQRLKRDSRMTLRIEELDPGVRDRILSKASSPEDDLLSAERRAALGQVIGELSQCQRSLLALVVEEDISVANATRRLGVLPNTARKRWAATTEKLARTLHRTDIRKLFEP